MNCASARGSLFRSGRSGSALSAIWITVAGILLSVSLSTARAQTTVRYQQVVKGGVAMVGNAHYRRSSDFGNPIVVNDVDGDPSTSISSSADLVLPAGSQIVYAYLTVQTGYQSSQGTGPMTSVRFRVPGGGYQTLSAASPGYLGNRTTSEAASGGSRFYRQIMFDVTGLVPANGYVSNAGGGAGGRYYLADPVPGFGAGGTGSAARSRLGGWSLIVVYRNANSLPRAITVADNWQFFGAGNLSINTDVPNVQLPNGGSVTATVGVAATYGDPSGSGGGFTCGNCDDFLSFGIAGGALSNLADPVQGVTSDALNSTIGWAAGNDVSADGGPAIAGNYAARNPASGFTPATYTPIGAWGSADYDSDIFDASGILPADGSVRTLRFQQRSTGNDWLVSGSYFVSVETGVAELDKSVSPATVTDGGAATYTFTLDNTSPTAVALTGIGFTDTLPGSLRVATPANIVNTCGGTVTAAAGGTTIAASGISLGVGFSCAISVDVTNVPGQTNPSCASNPGAFTNSVDNISGTPGTLVPDFEPVCLTVQPAGTITIVKDAVPDNPQDFDFTTTGTGLSDFSLDDDADATLPNTRTFTGLAAGSYSVTEAVVAGWGLTGLACTDPDNGSTADLAARTATIDLDPGETVTCTYTNTLGSLSAFPGCTAELYLARIDPGTGTQLDQFDTSSNPFVYDNLGASTTVYNAIGFNPADSLIYGLTSVGALVRVGSDGAVQNLGPVTGLPAGGYLAGEIGADGFYYVKGGNPNLLYRIDLSIMPAVATPIVVTIPFNAADLAWGPGGLLYTQDHTSGQFYSVTTTGVVTTIGSPNPVLGFGAFYGAPNGVWGIHNASGVFYRFDLATGEITAISDAPSSSGNDGAKCANTNLAFPSDLSITKDDGVDLYVSGDPLVYEIVVSNLGPFGLQDAAVTDALPPGVTIASWTCATTSGGGSCDAASGSASGTNAIDTTVDLPVNASVTFTLTMTVPGDQLGDFSNTVVVTPDPVDTVDPTPDNNSATDTDGSQADLSITKTNTPGVNGEVDQAGDTVTSGATTTYQIRVTNNGPNNVDGAVVHDVPGVGLDCPSGDPVVISGDGVPTGSFTVADLTGSGIALGVLGVGEVAVLEFSCGVQ